MIPRYEVKEITTIWSDESKFKKFLEVELALLKTLEKHHIIPANTAEQFKQVQIDQKRIQELEIETKHDIISFCTSITEQVAPEFSKYFHFGVTSSDIIDTTLSLQIKESLILLIKDLELLDKIFDQLIDQTKDLLCLGRSHGMYAEPMIFAQKFLIFKAELGRRISHYKILINQEITGCLSGAVGSYTILTTEIEEDALKLLNLPRENVSSQIISRDHVALITAAGSLTASLFEKIAVELRQLHQSDVDEIAEGFGKNQKGSSTMPHKKNPISSENITGIARIIKSHHQVALENNVLWYERDISHSSAERLYLPDHFGLLLYATRRLKSTLENLEIKKDNIRQKVQRNPQVLSSYLLHQLILTENKSREELYNIVQKSFFTHAGKNDFINLVIKDLTNIGIDSSKLHFSWEILEKHYINTFKKLLK